METKACLQENATPTYPPKPLGPTAPCGAGDNSCNRSAWLPCLGSWPARRLTGFPAPPSRSSCRPLPAGAPTPLPPPSAQTGREPLAPTALGGKKQAGRKRRGGYERGAGQPPRRLQAVHVDRRGDDTAPPPPSHILPHQISTNHPPQSP